MAEWNVKFVMFLPKMSREHIGKGEPFQGIKSQAGLSERQRNRKMHLLAPGRKFGRSLVAFATAWVDEAIGGGVLGDWSLSHGPSPGTGQIHKCRALPEDALLTLLIHSSYTRVIQIFIS